MVLVECVCLIAYPLFDIIMSMIGDFDFVFVFM